MSLATVLFLWIALAAAAPALDVPGGAVDQAAELRHQASFALIAPDVGLFTVTRTYAKKVPGPGVRLDRDLALPALSVVTSFAVRTGGPWRKGRLGRDLHDANGGGARGAGGGDPRRPWASLGDGAGGSAHVLTAPLGPNDEIQIRYTAWAQAEARPGGRRWGYCGGDPWANAGPLPELALPAGHPELSVRPDPELVGCLIVDKSEPDGPAPIARFGVYPLAKGAWWWRLDLAVPARLADVPGPDPSAPIVFVLDASRSQGSLRPQLEIVRPFLANTPGAEVELVLVSRTAERLFGRFVPAGEIDRALPAGLAKRPLGNGSFLDRGAALAAELLRGAGRPGRIIFFTDESLRSRFDQAGTVAVLRGAPKGTVVHLVHPSAWGTDPRVTHRVPEGLDALAAALGGGAYDVIVAKGKGANGAYVAPPPEALRTLLRPNGLESLELQRTSGRGDRAWPAQPDSIPDDHLDAGETRVWSGVSSAPPPSRLAFTGWVWGRKMTIPVRRDPIFERRLPRLATSADDVIGCQDDTRHVKQALIGGFLAPGLSFRVPGSGPDEEVHYSPGIPSDCGGGHLGGGYVSGTLGPSADLAPHLGVALDRCALAVDPAGPVRARIETHRAEILDLVIDGGDEATRVCLEEAIWSLSLPASFDLVRGSRVDHTLTFAPRVTAPAKP